MKTVKTVKTVKPSDPAQPVTPGEIPVLVTTAHRGVFFGYRSNTGLPLDGNLLLRRARMAVYWDADVRGVLGLAVTGPSRGCRITPAVASLDLNAITSVALCSPEAAAAWETAPWAR